MTIPRVSVITPVYNGVRFISQTVESVIGQTLRDWEYVIVDDGSTDATLARIESYATGDPRIRTIRQVNSGAIAARNAGYSASDRFSSYLLFLDSDDVLEPEMLSVMTNYLDRHPDVAMAFCEPTWIDADDKPLSYGSPGARYVPSRWGVRRLPSNRPDTPFIALFFWGRVGPSISILRRSVYDTTGGWDERQGYYAEDLDLWLRIALRHQIHYVSRELVRRRIHGQNYGMKAPARAQELKLYNRWLNADWLTPQELQMVRHAWRLRQRRFVPYLWFTWGSGHVRHGELARAAVCYLRGARRLATYVAAAVRGRTPQGPVW